MYTPWAIDVVAFKAFLKAASLSKMLKEVYTEMNIVVLFAGETMQIGQICL